MSKAAEKKSTGESTESIIVEKGKAGYPAIYMISAEDARTLGDVKRAAQQLNRHLYIWTLGTGIVRENNQIVQNTEAPPDALDAAKSIESKAIIVLRHFHHFMEDPITQAKLLDLIPDFKVKQKMLVILTPVLKIPLELEKELTLVETKLPDKAALGKVLDGIIKASKIEQSKQPNVDNREKLLEAALGLTTSEAESALSLSYVQPKMHDKPLWDPKVVMQEKCYALRKSGLVDYHPAGTGGLKQVGGLEILKEWIGKRKKAFTDEAEKFGLPWPKGMLLVGPPGSGKSLCAQAVSEELELPLLRCDMGRIFAGLVGASESNARRVIELAEATAPCVLWLDEIEKGFAGSGSGGNLDSGVGSRVLGTFLTWMQEKKAPVFVYATANNVEMLPPELLRKGRFDEIFAVHLPEKDERIDIFTIHITKKGREKLLGKKIDVEKLADATFGFSGAEIEAAINEAMFTAFADDKDLSTEYIENAIRSTKPLSETMKSQIERIKTWCQGRARSANKVPETSPVKGGRAVEA